MPSSNTSSSPAAPIVSLNPKHECWPKLWAQIPDAPETVNIQGQASSLLLPSVAIVGTRRATLRGMAFARALGFVLASRGWCVVSGLALGIDAAAHKGALEGGGPTVAVMGTGLNRIYPAIHGSLRKAIEANGCCLSEYQNDTGPRQYHFPQRNRLIAGMVKAVVVVEAPRKRGALLTAQMALDHDREVFAVPGPVDQDSSRGCHHLLRQGAHLLETADDLTQVLGNPERVNEGDQSMPPTVKGPVDGSSARWILDRLDFDGIARDDLRRKFMGTEEVWSEGMMALELAGLIRRLPGGRLARTMWRL